PLPYQVFIGQPLAYQSNRLCVRRLLLFRSPQLEHDRPGTKAGHDDEPSKYRHVLQEEQALHLLLYTSGISPVTVENERSWDLQKCQYNRSCACPNPADNAGSRYKLRHQRCPQKNRNDGKSLIRQIGYRWSPLINSHQSGDDENRREHDTADQSTVGLQFIHEMQPPEQSVSDDHLERLR